jgi:type IV secretion system protein VirD4
MRTDAEERLNIDELLDDLMRGRKAGGVGRLPDAHFELPSNIVSSPSMQFNLRGNPEGKLFLGALGGNIIEGDRFPDGRRNRFVDGGLPIGCLDDRHIVTTAGSRGGKGRSLLVPNLCLAPATASILCVDPKGDNAKLTARFRAEVLQQRVGVLDPFGVCGTTAQKYGVAFNPIEILENCDDPSFVPNANLIADSMIESGDFKDRHWDTTAQQFLGPLCAHVARHERYAGHRNLISVWHLVSEATTPDPNQPDRSWLELEMLGNDSANGYIRSGARQFYGRLGGEFSSILSNLRKHIFWVGMDSMADCLTGKSIDLRDFKRDSMTLYASLPAMRMTDLSGWLRLIVQMTLAAHEEVPTKERFRQTLLMLDEFHILGKLSCLEVAAAQIAGMGAKIWAVVQDLGQIKSRYSASWETFIGNAGVLQFFSLADATTLEYVSKRLGLTSCLSRSTNMPTFEQASRNAASGESWSINSQPLMTPEEICRYFARDDRKLRQLVLRPGYHPMILQRVFYDRHPWFKGKFDA